MTVSTTVSSIIPAQFDIFAGLDVDKKSMATTFTDHGTLFKSLRLPYSSTQLLNYVDKHFRGNESLSFMKPDRRGLACTMI